MAWIDQHCHIDPGPDGVAQVAEANAAGVMRMVSVGCDLEQSTQMAAIALEHDGVYATAGVHPHEASGGLDGIAELLDLPRSSPWGRRASTITTSTRPGSAARRVRRPDSVGERA